MGLIGPTVSKTYTGKIQIHTDPEGLSSESEENGRPVWPNPIGRAR